jgi:hypothetical protein
MLKCSRKVSLHFEVSLALIPWLQMFRFVSSPRRIVDLFETEVEIERSATRPWKLEDCFDAYFTGPRDT